MKKTIITLMVLICGIAAFAAGTSEEAMRFIRSFVDASNNYSPSLLSMYSDNAKIIRQVVKPDGSTANAYFAMRDYKKQMKISAGLAKMRNYKNYYSDYKVTKTSDGYKIDAMRKPSLSNYKLKAYFVVEKQPSGKWLIVEEMMQTKEQVFLKYAR